MNIGGDLLVRHDCQNRPPRPRGNYPPNSLPRPDDRLQPRCVRLRFGVSLQGFQIRVLKFWVRVLGLGVWDLGPWILVLRFFGEHFGVRGLGFDAPDCLARPDSRLQP